MTEETPGDVFEALPRYAEATRFADWFVPAEGVEYGWVADYAKDRYAQQSAAFKELDDKAAAIVTYLGSGTGVLTLGALAATATSTVHWGVIVSLLVPFGMAVASLWTALAARLTVHAPLPPSVRDAVRYAEHHKGKGREAFIGQWHATQVVMLAVQERKAAIVDRATRRCAWAVTALAVPLLAVLVVRAVH